MPVATVKPTVSPHHNPLSPTPLAPNVSAAPTGRPNTQNRKEVPTRHQRLPPHAPEHAPRRRLSAVRQLEQRGDVCDLRRRVDDLAIRREHVPEVVRRPREDGRARRHEPQTHREGDEHGVPGARVVARPERVPDPDRARGDGDGKGQRQKRQRSRVGHREVRVERLPRPGTPPGSVVTSKLHASIRSITAPGNARRQKRGRHRLSVARG